MYTSQIGFSVSYFYTTHLKQKSVKEDKYHKGLEHPKILKFVQHTMPGRSLTPHTRQKEN